MGDPVMITQYPEPPDTTWEDLQRYASVRLLADMFLADERSYGLPLSGAADRWARAEAAYERMQQEAA